MPLHVTEAEMRRLLAMPSKTAQDAPGRVIGRGVVTEPAYASKLEARYAAVLQQRVLAGDVHQWWYEPFNLRLASNTYYRPDFLVQLGSGYLHLIEVKGFWREDARAKWKIAAALYPCFTFIAIQYIHKQWQEERLNDA